MRMHMLILVAALAIGGGGAAIARCADDLKELQARINRAILHQPPPPEAQAAAKEMAKATKNSNNMDEVDCYNTVARVRRILATPPPPAKAEKAEK